MINRQNRSLWIDHKGGLRVAGHQVSGRRFCLDGGAGSVNLIIFGVFGDAPGHFYFQVGKVFSVPFHESTDHLGVAVQGVGVIVSVSG